MGAFDPYPYPILLAEEMNSMFSKKKNKHSYFVADFIWSQDNYACICWYFLPMRDGF